MKPHPLLTDTLAGLRATFSRPAPVADRYTSDDYLRALQAEIRQARPERTINETLAAYEGRVLED